MTHLMSARERLLEAVWGWEYPPRRTGTHAGGIRRLDDDPAK
jgi:hypothetical protein